jgi:hypothetical protein
MFDWISRTVRHAVLLVAGLLALALLSAWGGNHVPSVAAGAAPSSGAAGGAPMVTDAVRAGQIAEAARSPVVRLQQAVRSLALLEAAERTLGRAAVEASSGTSFVDMVHHARTLQQSATRQLGAPHLR